MTTCPDCGTPLGGCDHVANIPTSPATEAMASSEREPLTVEAIKSMASTLGGYRLEENAFLDADTIIVAKGKSIVFVTTFGEAFKARGEAECIHEMIPLASAKMCRKCSRVRDAVAETAIDQSNEAQFGSTGRDFLEDAKRINAERYGGMLTEVQVKILADGLVLGWDMNQGDATP